MEWIEDCPEENFQGKNRYPRNKMETRCSEKRFDTEIRTWTTSLHKIAHTTLKKSDKIYKKDW